MRIKQLLILVTMICCNSIGFAADGVYTSTLRESTFAVNQNAAVRDSIFYDNSLNGTIQRMNSIRNIIQLRLNEYSDLRMPDSFSVTIHLEITYSPLSEPTTDYTIADSVLTINYNQLKTYTARDIIYFENAVYVSVKITNIQVQNANLADLQPFLVLENLLIPDRDFVFACSEGQDLIASVSWTDLSMQTGELRAMWANNSAAEEYDLEWTYIDNSALDAGKYNSDGQLNPLLVFKNNATRVSLKGTKTFYDIPLLYEGGGELYFRVRAVQYLPSGERKTGPWSSESVSGLGTYAITTGHQENLNWQSAISFAEDGKRKAVVQYFDGSLYNRQTVTKDNTTEKTVVAETFYDKQGKPAIQVMPSPTLSSLIQYTPYFNTALNSLEYDNDVYDPIGKICNTGAPPMDTLSGAAKYYSSANPEANEGIHQFIPNAYKFAFSETEYTNDNTGRIAKQGGVGADHQIGSGRETKYYYGTPSQSELDAMFGTEAGIASHYQKNMVRDANGQYSVSYIDMAGRTIATALAGQVSSTILSPLSNNNKRLITDDLLDASNNVTKGPVVESINTLLVPVSGTYTFTYQLNPESLNLQDCEGAEICYDCLYDLEITVVDDCNNAKLPGGVPYLETKNNFSLAGLDTTCTPAGTVSMEFSLYLEEGSYTVTKRLRMSEQKMDEYRSNVFLPHNTCESYEDIYTRTMTSVLNRIGDCENDSLGTVSQRAQMLTDLTPPFGQYADPTGNGCELLSIFSVYQHPKGSYKDENGADDLVIVTRNGQQVPLKPEELTKEEFIENFKPSWAATLLEFHPEYPILTRYESLAASHEWNRDFENTETYAEAKARGYLNPTNSTVSPASKFPVATGDTLFTLSAGADAKAFMESYLFDVIGGSSTLTLWGYATAVAKCTETEESQISTVCEQWAYPAAAFDEVSLCAGELDMAWRIFRGLYLSKKEEWIDQYIRTGAGTSGFDSASAACSPVFPRRDLAIDALGLGSVTDYRQAQEAGSQSATAYYDQTCRGYATRWLEQLSPCDYANYPSADLNVLIDRLVVVCKEGADPNHPFGASTVQPSSVASERSFDDVIRNFNAEHSIPYGSNCNGYLINLPKAWEGTSVLATALPSFTKPDSCTCERLNSLYDEYQSVQGSYTSFSNYLAVKYKTTISQDDLNTLMGMCSGSISCKYIEKAIELPPILQCVSASICVNCDQVKGLKAEYDSLFSTSQPAILTQPDEVQEKKNQLFASFMNSRLGFGKTAEEYLDFIAACPQQAPASACDTSWTVYNPGQNLEIHNDFYLNSYNNIQPYSQHFDGQHFIAPAQAQIGQYILVNKNVSVPTADTMITVKWRLQLSSESEMINPVVKTNGAHGINTNNWYGATYAKDPTDTTWVIATTVLNRIGAINYVSGLGLISNNHPFMADYVRVYDSQNQLLYAEEFNGTCAVGNAMNTMLCGEGAQDRPLPEAPEPCADSTFLTTITATDIFRAYKDSLNDVFNDLYSQRCLAAASLETFTVKHEVQEYHRTLYYYDLAGNLVKTIPPEGVDESVYSNPTWLNDVKNARTAGTWLGPQHTLATTYRYNSLNQVVSQHSPDGGKSEFWYDRLGRLAVSQNANQLAGNDYSYTVYDALGRITEVGQKQQSTVMTQAISRDQAVLDAWLNNGAGFEQVTRTVYDLPATLPLIPGSAAATFRQKGYTLRNRVSHTLLYEALLVNAANEPLYDDYTTGTYFSYDIHGNVDSLLQDYRSGMMQQHGLNRFKLMAYKYDLVSGKVNEVHYQPGERDELYHRYRYDAENRLTDVYTTFKKQFIGEERLEEHEAFYQYYKHGPLAKAIIGEQQVQGIDYAYTIQGWLKGVNLLSSLDGSGMARDAFSFSLHYYKPDTRNYSSGDYKPIGSNVSPVVYAWGISEYRPLYNGNIAAMAVDIKKLDKGLVYNYGYDQLNRLVSMDAWDGWNTANNVFAPNKLQDYREQVSYDGNGNILTYFRNGEGTTKAMDQLTYGYNKQNNKLVNNRLRHVKDAIAAGNYADDMDDQADDNYDYDAIGNMTSDVQAGISSITWTVYGKIDQITKTNGNTIKHTYDASGNRISKTVTTGTSNTTTWYVRDASGNVMGIYKQDGTTLTLREQNIYGSSRLGVWNRNVDMDVALPTLNTSAGIGSITTTNFARGNKEYELSNHLGNVLVTLSDKKITAGTGSTVTSYEPDILLAQDYYPFGMKMPGRKWATGDTYTTTTTTSINPAPGGGSVTSPVVLYDHPFSSPYDYPYTKIPSTLSQYLTTTGWTNSRGTWSGSGNNYIYVNGSTPATTTVTLTLNVADGYILNLSSYDFLAKSQNGGYRSWSLAINGIAAGVGSLTVSNNNNFGTANTGTFGSSFSSLTGQVTVVLTVSNATGNGDFRLDNFLLNGYIQQVTTNTTTTLIAGPGKDYRYGFNGKEEDDEVKGDGNQQDYGMRIYDPRLGRFLSVDPLTRQYPMLTPYQFASNTPIMAIDLDGKEAVVVTGSASAFGVFFGGEVGAGLAITPSGISIIQTSNFKLGGGVYLGAAVNFTILPGVKTASDLEGFGIGLGFDAADFVSIAGSIEYTSAGWAWTGSLGGGAGVYGALQGSYTSIIKTITWKDIGMFIVNQAENPQVGKFLVEAFDLKSKGKITSNDILQGYKKVVNEVVSQQVKNLKADIEKSNGRISEIDDALNTSNNSGLLTRLFTWQERLTLKGEKKELQLSIETKKKETKVLLDIQENVNQIKIE